MSRHARTPQKVAPPAQTHAQATARRAHGAPAPVRRELVTDHAVPDLARHKDAAVHAPLPRPFTTCDAAAPRSRDPAAVVDWVRAGPRTALPHRDAVEMYLGRALGPIDVVLGGRARTAGELLGARAFVAGNLIGFASESPTPRQILHEAVHVLQQGGAPLPRTPLAEGSLPVASPDARAEREAAAIAGGAPAATIAPAQLGVYRDGETPLPVNVDTTEDDLKAAQADPTKDLPKSKKRFLEFMQMDPWKVVELMGTARTLGDLRARVGKRKGKEGEDRKTFEPWFKESSKLLFKRSDYAKAFKTPLSDSQAADDMAAARDDANLKKGGWIISGRPTRVGIVGELDETGAPDTETRIHVLIGRTNKDALDYFERVQEVASGGAEKTDPKEILQDLKGMVIELRAVAAGKAPFVMKKVALPAAPFDQVIKDADKALADFQTTQIRKDAFEAASTIRENLIEAIIVAYLDDLDELHNHIVESDVFKNPYQGVKGTTWERYIPRAFPKLVALSINTEIQPIFGDKLGEASWVRSGHLLKVRKGDGVALTLKAEDHTIIEAKAYKAESAPGTEEIQQMQDYAKIIELQIPGYLRKKTGGPDVPHAGVDKQLFKKVFYKFTSTPTAAKWIPALDAHLTGKYSTDPDVNTPASNKETLEAYQKALKALIPKAKTSKHPGFDTEIKPVLTKIEEALKATAKPEAEATKEVETIRAEMIAAIVKSYDDDMDALYTDAIDGSLFGAPHLAVNGLIFDKWLETKRSTWPRDKLKTPMRGVVVKLRPIFSITKAATGTTFADGSKDLELEYEIVDAIIVIDRRGVPAAPTADDQKLMKDASDLAVNKAPGYLQVKEGTTNRATRFSASKMRFHFDDVAHAQKWETDYLALKAPRTVIPDPKGAPSFTGSLKSSPEFKFKVEDADRLEHTFKKDQITQPPGPAGAAAAEEITIKLKQQRSPELESGSLKISVGAKDLVTQAAPEVKPLQSTPLDAKSKANPVLRGKYENKVGGAKSKLDDLLKRIETDVKLITGGIEASLRVTPGPSGIPNVLLEEAVIKVTYTGSKPLISGSVGIKHASGKISGKLEFSGSDAISVTGSVSIENIVEGLEKVTASVAYTSKTDDKPESLHFKVASATIKRKIGGVTLGGTVSNVDYDAIAGTLSATVTSLTADFGPFGMAEGKAVIENNELTKAEIKYESPTLSYPKGPTPYIKGGKLTGGFTYNNGKFGGTLGGAGTISVAALKTFAPNGIDVGVTATLGENGQWSGAFTASGLQFGKYLSIPLVEVKLRPDGEVEGKIQLQVKGIPKIETFSPTISIGPAGVSLQAFSVTGKIPKERETQRFWGSITVAYQQGGLFSITVRANMKVREGIEVAGTLTYSRVDGKDVLSGSLSTVKDIVILDTTKNVEVVKPIEKQISLVNVYGIGIYLEIGIAVKFGLSFKLTLKPTITLNNFVLDTLAFDSIEAQLALSALITAALTLEPKIGLGLYVASPSLLRGGGGLKIPITASATIAASPTVKATYHKPKVKEGEAVDPDAPYTLDTAAQVSLSIMFGIDAAIFPYATFVVLDGAFRKEWTAQDPLTKFVILAPRELFRYTVDFNSGVKSNDDPKTGPNPDARPAAGVKDEPVSTPAPKETKVDAIDETKDAKKETEKPAGDKAEDKEGGFSLATLLEKVKDNSVYKAVHGVLESVFGAFEKIGAFIADAVKFIKKWVGHAIDAVTRALKAIKEGGLFKYVKQFFGEKINAISSDLWEIVEPLFDALASSEDILRDTIFGLFDEEFPTSLSGILEWCFNIMAKLYGGAWSSITSFGKGLYNMAKKLIEVAPRALRRFLNKLIDAGMIGAKQSDPWAYKVRLGSLASFSDSTNTRFSPVYPAAKALALALSLAGADHKGGDENYWVDE